MLPNFPKTKRRFAIFLNEVMKAKVRERSGVFGDIRGTRFFEGDKMSISYDDGTSEEKPFQVIEVRATVTVGDLIERGFVLTGQTMDSLADQMAEKQVRMVLDGLEAACEKTGNKVDGKGQKFSAEMFMEMIEKVDLDFKNGEPQFPTMVTGPGTAEKMAEALRPLEEDPDVKSRFEELIKRKRREWDARESSRKLVE